MYVKSSIYIFVYSYTHRSFLNVHNSFSILHLFNILLAQSFKQSINKLLTKATICNTRATTCTMWAMMWMTRAKMLSTSLRTKCPPPVCSSWPPSRCASWPPSRFASFFVTMCPTRVTLMWYIIKTWLDIFLNISQWIC